MISPATASLVASQRAPSYGYVSDAEGAGLLRGAPWKRLVVLGDSLAAGIGEDTPGYPSGGWAATFARVLQRVQPELAFLNLGRRDLITREVRATQLQPALEFASDLAVLICGGNDLLRRDYDLASVASDLDDMVRGLREGGSDVLLFGLMDITTTGLIDPRFAATMHERLVALADVNRNIADHRNAMYLPMTEHPAASNRNVYSRDRLHPNGRGHAILASAVIRLLASESVPARSDDMIR